MKRIIPSIVFLFLIGGLSPTRADFVISTDRTSFVSNDLESWDGPVFGGGFQRHEGLGLFSGGLSSFASVPFDQTLGVTFNGALFIGVSSTPIPGNPRFPGGTAFYNINGVFAQGSIPVHGFGFFVTRVSPATTMRVFDIAGHSQEFVLSGTSYLQPSGFGDASGFIGITSDVPISRFQLSESVTDSTAVLNVSEVQINAAVPAPPGIVAAVIGLFCLGGYTRRRSATSARSRAVIPPG